MTLPSNTHHIREYRESDRERVVALLDASVGVGFWDPERDLDDIALVAEAEGGIVGVATASLGGAGVEGSEYAEPIGSVRLVAVDRAARRQGVATSLVRYASELLESQGARTLVAYAWVHHDEGVAPLAGALRASDYSCAGRLEDFYAGVSGPECPACHTSPCRCAADLYLRYK